MAAREFRITGWHVFIAFAVFFGVIVAANAVMITLAVTTFTGEDVKAAYGTGLRYNDILDTRADSRALGWTMDVRQGEGAAPLVVTIKDKNARPVGGLALRGQLKRPVQAKLDRDVDFREVSPGVYHAVLSDLAAGQWDLIVRADLGGDRTFEAQRRL